MANKNKGEHKKDQSFKSETNLEVVTGILINTGTLLDDLKHSYKPCEFDQLVHPSDLRNP